MTVRKDRMYAELVEENKRLRSKVEAFERGAAQRALLAGLPLPPKVIEAVQALAQEAESAGSYFAREVARHYQNPASIGAENAREWARDLHAKVDAALAVLPCLTVEKDR